MLLPSACSGYMDFVRGLLAAYTTCALSADKAERWRAAPSRDTIRRQLHKTDNRMLARYVIVPIVSCSQHKPVLRNLPRYQVLERHATKSWLSLKRLWRDQVETNFQAQIHKTGLVRSRSRVMAYELSHTPA